ncbi:SMI1/KNR4 family protein [Bacillus thuringiensis]|uniref:1,3-beta-glucan synthase regulator n=1 Tax=Bacillus thuringiensis TaxID=1428 RepID=A0A9X7BGP4_BACTU|nr:SMI1/KNR4 family protein [Bacillus thuringiensis]PET20611.1 1,3-beta-glucan synthase regulator [Bacillus thuringiensis]PFL06745.1 1,3-beta-glucan synthase regulator [Bacillus thuringiensis]PFV19397.1 1,3-beta-glucan synthase regulator [Bacillus thuringiensis]PGU37051.1 1,3-beta-glucan synthase regulator [Bacillus thuringiensis]
MKEVREYIETKKQGVWMLYPIKDNRNVTKTWDDIVRQNIDIRDESMPENLIIIGDDGSGDKLCFKINNGKMDDEIYIWYHEDDEMEEISPSLKKFIMETIQEDDVF